LSWKHKFAATNVWCGLCGAILCALILLTFARNNDYSSEEAVWRDVVAKRPGNLRARNDLAVALSEAGKFEEAVMEYDRVLSSIPGDILAKLNAGKSVITDVFATNSFEYHYFRANVNKATLMSNRKNGENEAVKLYIKALRIAPFNKDVIEKLKNVLRKMNIQESLIDDELRHLLISAEN
jgi:tetratricopeptide (TPR) repeat protein